MKDHHKDKAHSEHKHGHKAHPHHKGAGMSYFEKDHWQKKVDDVQVADMKYSPSEMNQMEEYKKSVDGLSGYARKHKAQH